MAIVIAAFGSFLYLRSQDQLDESVNDNLELRTTDLTTLIADTSAGERPVTVETLDPEDSLAQVVDDNGTPLLATDQLGSASVLSPAELAEAMTGPAMFEREEMEALDGRVRLLATPLERDGRLLVTIVGATLEDRDDALRSLAFLLLLGGPAALILAGAAGYWVAGRALSPVERMRKEAAAITASEPGDRLATPEADDELRRLSTTLNEMLGRLEAGLERERRFVDDASHELRTPLALHKTELELAQRYATDEAELRAAIASGIVEVDRLAQLAEDLLVVARSGEDGLALKIEQIDASDLFETVATRFASRLKEAERSMAIRSDVGVSVAADRLRVEQALTNMVENALRHGTGEIELASERRGSRVRLHVRDQGAGFPDDFRERAFERFSRGDAARGRGGAGLGLAIVDAIATAHGGTAGADNVEAGGADVWIELSSM